MTRVMICGARRKDDIRLLVKAGVDAVGLITEVWQPIACNLSRAEAHAFARLTPPFVSSVLIVTEERVDEICAMAEHVAADILQLHGFDRLEDIARVKARLGRKVIKTLHVQGEHMAESDDPVAYAQQCIAAGADAILLDSYQKDKVGGTGATMSLDLARSLRDDIYPVPLILAGGLNATNIVAAIETVRPYAVDTFSGVTTAGYLDAGRVATFIARIRAVEEV